jgi:hypothetical protein
MSSIEVITLLVADFAYPDGNTWILQEPGDRVG